MFVADLHNDVLQRAIVGEDIITKSNNGHTDIERLIEGKINLEVFAIWMPKHYLQHAAFSRANELIDKLEEIDKKTDLLIKINSLGDINFKKDKTLYAAIGIEGGECFEGSIDKLEHFINRGLFYLGPTWNYSTDLATSAYDEKFNLKNIKSIGLTKFGLESLKLCEERGVLIDVSHIGEKSFWDIMKIAKNPIIASHSNAHTLCPHFRNLKDDQIKAIKEKKGIICLNLYPAFIDIDFQEKDKKFKESLKNDLNNIDLKYQNPDLRWVYRQYFLQKSLYSIVPSLEKFVDHIEYIINLIGIDYVGIGSDYDGTDCLPKGIIDCLDHMKIGDELKKRGYNEKDIEKVMGLNLLRVYDLIKSKSN